MPLSRSYASGAIQAFPLLLALAVFAPSLTGGFVFDDRDFLAQNPFLRSSAAFWECWTQPYWHLAVAHLPSPYYRPLGTTSFVLLERLGGGQPWIFRAFSILLHAACAWLVTGVGRRLGLPRGAALLAGCWFAVHAGHVEVVAWSTAVTGLLATLFSLLAMSAWLSRRWFAVGCWMLAALLSKEDAFGVAAALGLFALPMARRNLRPFLSVAAPVLLVLLLRSAALESASAGLAEYARIQTGEGLNPLPAFGMLLRGLLAPWPVAPFHPIPRPGESLRLLLPAVIGLLGLAGAGACLRAGRGPRLAVAILVIGSLPALLGGWMGGFSNAANLRMGLLPGTGMAWLLGFGVTAAPAVLAAATPRRLAAAFAVLILAHAATTWQTLPHWRDDRSLFTWGLRASPNSTFPPIGLARLDFARAQSLPPGDPGRAAALDRAEAAVARGLAVDTRVWRVPAFATEQLRAAEGHLRYLHGELDAAERLYRQLLADFPESGSGRLGLAAVIGTRGERDLAQGALAEGRERLRQSVALFRAAQARSPRCLAEAYLGEARALALLGATAEASTALARAEDIRGRER